MRIRRKKPVWYHKDGERIAQKSPGGFLFWLLYRFWLGGLFRFFLTNGIANWMTRIWYTSRLSKWRIGPFIRRHKIDMSEFAKKKSEFVHFNDFFIRTLKKDARPIDKTPHTVASPADGTAYIVPHLSERTRFYVKEHRFSLESFVGSSALAEQYKDGMMLIIRLAPYDYHRFHMPVAGYLHDHGTIAGRYESVNPQAYQARVPLLTNRRQVFELKTATDNNMLLIAVGALCVGTIETTYNPNKNYHLKGSELGYFAFGGSTVALITQPGALHVRTDIITHSGQSDETAVHMGCAIGQWAKH